MIKAPKTAILALIALACMALPGFTSSQYTLLMRVKGQVQSKLQGSDKWFPVIRTRRLKSGDYARTLTNSVAKLQALTGVTAILGPNTTMSIETFEAGSKARIHLEGGGVRSVIKKVAQFLKGENYYEVETPNAVLAARGTDFTVVYVNEDTANQGSYIGPLASLPGFDALLAYSSPPNGSTVMHVFDGTVRTTGKGPAAGAPTDVGRGKSVVIYPDGSMAFLTQVPLNIIPRSLQPQRGEYPPPRPSHSTYTEPPVHPEGGLLNDGTKGTLLPSTTGNTGNIEVQIDFGNTTNSGMYP